MKKDNIIKINLIFSINIFIYFFLIYDPIQQLTNIDKNFSIIYLLKKVFIEYIYFFLLINLLLFCVIKLIKKNQKLELLNFFIVYFLVATIIYSTLLPQPEIYFDNTNLQNKLSSVLFKNSRIMTVFIDIVILLLIFFLCKFAIKQNFSFNNIPIIIFLILSTNLVISFPYKNLSVDIKEKEILRISNKENKILFILDGFRSSNFQLLRNKIKQNLKSIDNDFIFFENAFTKHPGTWGSLPELLKGYETSLKKEIYINNKISLNYYENKSFFKKKNNQEMKNNFKLNAYFDHRGGDHLLDNYNNKLSSIFAKLPYSLKYLFIKKIKQIYLKKELYLYILSLNPFKFLLDGYSLSIYKNQSHYFRSSQKILQNLSSNIQFEKDSQFIIFYTKYPHLPAVMDDKCNIQYNLQDNLKNYLNQSFCTLKYIESFINFLKEKNLYNQSEIIITSDHGWPTLSTEEQDEIEKKMTSWQSRFSIKSLETLFLYKPSKNKKIVADLLVDQKILPVQISKNILCDGINDEKICSGVLKLDQILSLKEQEIFILDPINVKVLKNYAIIKGDFKKWKNWKKIK